MCITVGRIWPSIFCTSCSKCLSPGLHAGLDPTCGRHHLEPARTQAATCSILGLSCEAQVGTEVKAGVGAGSG